ncbi:MAG TPA: hypothetical protein HA362_03730 [Nanoarchaeota archaeon]|nr:hypothetical protein [Nanoarchaeota archaeon]
MELEHKGVYLKCRHSQGCVKTEKRVEVRSYKDWDKWFFTQENEFVRLDETKGMVKVYGIAEMLDKWAVVWVRQDGYMKATCIPLDDLVETGNN